MTKIEILKFFLKQRLIAAAEEIFGAVEETIVEYQEEVSRTREENNRLRGMLDVKPEIILHKIDLHQPIVPVSKEQGAFEHLDLSPSRGQVDPEPTLIKEEPKSTESKVDHLETHVGARVCHVCGKFFSGNNELNDHMKIHPGEKTFRCPDCGKCFRKNPDLTAHKRVHTGERPYRCKFCGKGFTQSGNLAVHMKSHSGEKPHHCPVCGKSFSRTIAEYQQEVSRTKEENSRLRSMLDVHTKPEMRRDLQTTVSDEDPSDQRMSNTRANGATPDSVLVEVRKDGEPDGEHMMLHCVGAENQAGD
ncbi:hypothetical protein UPYG_G00152810 [Umbra pygmaea]|uniref:C2H2-type domain-containing protein n=1 Tax=Umbra pygmaea TaxID=75934 RepID=A0ABD0XDH7_UMBPY